jgi:hypothetical protein
MTETEERNKDWWKCKAMSTYDDWRDSDRELRKQIAKLQHENSMLFTRLIGCTPKDLVKIEVGTQVCITILPPTEDRTSWLRKLLWGHR